MSLLHKKLVLNALLLSLIKKMKQLLIMKEKKLMIVSFLEGKAKQSLSPQNCKSIGIEIAKSASDY